MMEKYREIQGKYQLQRLLGEGGEGKTYLAIDRQADRRVVVKEISENVTDIRMAAWEKLMRIGKVQGIVQLLDIIKEEQAVYMVLEYVEGRNGVEYLKEYGQGIPVKQVLQIMEPVVKGLSLLHDRGILHRDVSTDNILITADGRGLLCDFNLVCENGEDGVLDNNCRVKSGFSPLEMYMEDGEQGNWCDVYGVCATMYHMMTGQILEVPAMREGDDPFAGIYLKLPEQIKSLICSGLAVEWEGRLDSLQSIRQMIEQEKTINEESTQITNTQETTSVSEKQTEAYTAPPQMRTLPINTQGMTSLTPDNAMNAKQGKKAKNGTGRRMLIAVGIVCVILAFFAVGFTYYYMMNEEEGEEVSEQKTEELSESETAEFAEESSESIPEETAEEASDETVKEVAEETSDEAAKEATEITETDSDAVTEEPAKETTERAELTLEELMERYAEYMEMNSGEFVRVNSYKLVCINGDDLPECLMTYSNDNVSALMYYNKETDSCNYVLLYSGSQGDVGGTSVEYAPKGNVFCVVDERAGNNRRNAFYRFAQDGSVEAVGESRVIDTGTQMQLTIGSSVNARTDVSKAEYDEYNSDFGELAESVSYDNMFLTLDKAYEKYLAE